MSPNSRGSAGAPGPRYGKELQRPIQIFWPTTGSEAEFGFERTSIQLRDKSGANRSDVMLSRTRRGSAFVSVASALHVQIADAWGWMQEELALRANGFYRKGSALTPN